MPAVGATQNSMIPSFGKILAATPEAVVAGLAVMSGVSNTSGAPARHGGGLQTEANALWESAWKPPLASCLSQPSVHQFDPARSIVKCILQGVSNWEQRSEDPYDSLVVSRSVGNLKLGSAHSVPQLEQSTPDARGKVRRDAMTIMRGLDEYQRTMASVDALYSLHSSRRDLPSAKPPYESAALLSRLEQTQSVSKFKASTNYLSASMHKMLMDAGRQVYVLKPEWMRSRADREAFETKVDMHFSATPNAGMNDRQLRSLLFELAKYMNEKYT